MTNHILLRCCLPWQSLSDDKCKITKKREKANLRMSLVVEKMDCMATMVEEGEYMVGQGGSILVGDRIVEKGEYCIDRNRVRVCKDTRYARG